VKLHECWAAEQGQPTTALCKGVGSRSLGQVTGFVSQEDATLFADIFFLTEQKVILMIISFG